MLLENNDSHAIHAMKKRKDGICTNANDSTLKVAQNAHQTVKH